MTLFSIEEPDVNAHEEIAKGLLKFGNQTASELVRLYRMGKEILWQRPGYTVADAQAVIDAMGENAIPLFTLSASLGGFIALKYPGVLDSSELTSPVPYTVVDGRIVLDPTALYPTQGVPEEPGSQSE